MKKGAIPVKYIVAIIFAIIVIALIAYMFFTQSGIFQGVITEEVCEAQKARYCFEWSLAGEPNPPAGGWDSYAPGCTAIGVVDPGVDGCSTLGITIPG